METPELTQEQIDAIHRAWQYYPYRECYLFIKGDKWEVVSVKDRKAVKQWIKDGWSAYKSL